MSRVVRVKSRDPKGRASKSMRDMKVILVSGIFVITCVWVSLGIVRIALPCVMTILSTWHISRIKQTWLESLIKHLLLFSNHFSIATCWVKNSASAYTVFSDSAGSQKARCFQSRQHYSPAILRALGDWRLKHKRSVHQCIHHPIKGAFAIHIRPFKSLELMIKIRELFGPTGVGLAHYLHNHWGPHIQLQPQGRYHRDQQQSCQLQRPQNQLGNLAPLLDIGIIGTYIIVELLGLYIQTITNLYQIRKMLWPRLILGNKKRPSLVDHARLILHWVDPTSLVASNTWRPPYCRCSPRPFGWTLAWRYRGFFLSEDPIVLNSRQVKSIEMRKLLIQFSCFCWSPFNPIYFQEIEHLSSHPFPNVPSAVTKSCQPHSSTKHQAEATQPSCWESFHWNLPRL